MTCRLAVLEGGFVRRSYFPKIQKDDLDILAEYDDFVTFL